MRILVFTLFACIIGVTDLHAQSGKSPVSIPEYLAPRTSNFDPFEPEYVHVNLRDGSTIPVVFDLHTEEHNEEFAHALMYTEARSNPEGAMYCDGIYDLVINQAGEFMIRLREVNICIESNSQVFVVNYSVSRELDDNERDAVGYRLAERVNADVEYGKTDEEIKAMADAGTINSVQIGNQVWMAENLSVDHFRNGDSILYAKNAEEWLRAAAEGIPAYSYYNDDPEKGQLYGKIYNWYAVYDSRGLTPSGWRVPTVEDWDQLVYVLGDDFRDKLMSNYHWSTCYLNSERDSIGYRDEVNTTGFGALPGGRRYYQNAVFGGEAYEIWWYAFTNTDNPFARARILSSCSSSLQPAHEMREAAGYYVRAIRE